MKEDFLGGAAVVAVAVLALVAASAETFNAYLFDPMEAATTKTRAELKAQVLQARREGAMASSIGATGQQSAGAPRVEKAGTAPQAAAASEKTSQH